MRLTDFVVWWRSQHVVNSPEYLRAHGLRYQPSPHERATLSCRSDCGPRLITILRRSKK